MKWQKATTIKSGWSRCKLTGLRYSTGADAGSGHITALPRPQPPPSPPTTTSTPSQPPVLVSQDAPPQPSSPPSYKLLYSCTSLPNYTLNTLCCFTLHCSNVSKDMIWFTVSCLKMRAVVKGLFSQNREKQMFRFYLTRLWDGWSGDIKLQLQSTFSLELVTEKVYGLILFVIILERKKERKKDRCSFFILRGKTKFCWHL